MARTATARKSLLRKGIDGLTMIELLVVVVILGFLSLGLSSFLGVQLYESIRYEKGTREVDDASRIRHLLESEVSESDDIFYGQSLPGGACGSGASLFALRIPTDYDAALGLPKYFTTYYYESGGSIYRCGKPVLTNGRLDFGSSDVKSQITANISLSVNAGGSSSEVLDYQLLTPEGNVVVSARAYGQAEVIR